MPMDKQLLKKITDLLEEKRESSGLPLERELGLPPGLHMAMVSPELVQRRNASPVKAEFLSLADKFLHGLPVTPGCKEHIKEMVGVRFNFGAPTEDIVQDLTDAYETIAEGISPAEYERERFINNSDPIVHPDVVKAVAPSYITWGEQILNTYGDSEAIKSKVKYFRSKLI